jgi:Ca-activated chloride channel family protein
MNELLQALDTAHGWLPVLLARLTQVLVPFFGPGDLELAVPQALFLLPLPALVWALLPPYRERVESVRTPFFEEVAAASGQKPRKGAEVMSRTIFQLIIAVLGWVLILAAAARPEWVEPPLRKTDSARDLLLAVDLSQSMEARDFKAPDGRRIDRLEAVKLVLDDFISRREGDRIGLVVFGDAAYLQMPFTRDLKAGRQLLDETKIGMAGPRTVVGDAIGLGVKLFDGSDAKEKVLILLTDGNDTGSKVPPLKAAQIAAERRLKVHTIGIGDPAATGDSRVDIETLGKIAATTGGRSYLAQNRERLAGIYAELDKLESRELPAASYRPRRPLFQWPLGAALCLVFAFHGLMALRLIGRAILRRVEAVHA